MERGDDPLQFRKSQKFLCVYSDKNEFSKYCYAYLEIII